ncbi:MAG TPA: hypothetical protein VHB30_13510 [Solirubrobacteraceae bacterium]|nr:hypothetical protein [Solirubrobacteraceae bacterium]
MNEAPAATHEDGTRVYRGDSVESLLPRIREELGPNAIVTRQRTGLVGGLAGFFQRPCVEIEARPAPRSALGAGILAGDDDEIVLPPAGEPEAVAFVPGIEDPSLPDPLASPLPYTAPAAPARAAQAQDAAFHAPEREPVAVAGDPFAHVLRDASGALIVPPAIAPAPVAPPSGPVEIPVPPQSPPAEDALVEHGLEPALAAEVVGRVVAHAVPFASPRRMKSLVRAALARMVPIAEPPATAGRSIAFAGPRGAGKTLCAQRLASAYARASHPATSYVALRAGEGAELLAARVAAAGSAFAAPVSVAEAKAVVAAAPDGAVVVVDTPGTSSRDAAAISALGRELRSIGVQEVHLVLPATVSLAAAQELLAAYAPLAPTAMVVAHADATTQLGALVSLAVRHGLPISFLSHDPSEPEGLVPADAASLAGGLLP